MEPGQLQRNKKTGEWRVWNGQDWQPAKAQRSKSTGEYRADWGEGWKAPGNIGSDPLPKSMQPAVVVPERTTGQELGRQLGLTARYGLEGTLGFADQLLGPYREATNWLADKTGIDSLRAAPMSQYTTESLDLPQPETEGERMIGHASRALAGALPTMGLGALMQGSAALSPVARSVGGVMAASPGAQAASAIGAGAGQGAAEIAGAGAGGQTAAALLGGLTPMGMAGAVNSAKNMAGRIVNPQKYQAHQALGVTPSTLGAVSDSGLVRRLESVLDQNFVTGNLMSRAYERGRQGLEDALTAASERLAQGQPIPESLEKMGALARDAAEQSKKAFQNKAQQMEAAAYGPIGRFPANLKQTENVIQQEVGDLSPAAREAAEGRWRGPLKDILKDNDSGALNIATVRQARSKVGEAMSAPPTANTADAGERELKRLYAGLSKDIEQAVPAAHRQTIADYNRFYSHGKNIREGTDKTFFGKKDDSAMATAFGAADSAQLQQLREVIGPEAFNSLRAAHLRQLALGGGVAGNTGRAMPSQLSKALGRGRGALSPQVQNMLFGQEGNNLRALSDALAESRAYANTSNTGNVVSGGLLGLGLGAGKKLATAAMAGGLYGLGRAVTSPKMIERLYRAGLRPQSQPIRGAALPVATTATRPLWDYWTED